jgi:hypothetical protein
MQVGPMLRLPGVRLLQDARTEHAADGTAAILVPVLVPKPIKHSDLSANSRSAPC